ncbi:MAG: hypothetical protein ABFC96_06270 [Thermoguttaceae bacterium]
MRRCPACGNWTLDFDDYFGRFRCYDGACGWMPASTAERELNFLRHRTHPTALAAVTIPELQIIVTPTYDPDSDALSVDFGLDEPTFDLPEPDGRMIWKVSHSTDQVAGFTILGVKKLGFSQLNIDFIARKDTIERGLRLAPGLLSSGRVTRDAIEHIVVTALSDTPYAARRTPPATNSFREMLDRVEKSLAAS